MSVDCLEKGVLFMVKAGDRMLKLFNENPERIFQISQKQEKLGTITMNCGPYTPPAPIVVTFHKPTRSGTIHDGELLTATFADKQ